MSEAQRSKQLLLAAELFAGVRNVYAKAELQEHALVAYFLCMRCALRSDAAMPDYMKDMAAHYAEWVGHGAELIALQHLQRHDLSGFLAMLTIAASAYRDNTGSMSEIQQKRWDTFLYRHLINLHEHAKVRGALLARTDLAVVLRAIGLWGELSDGNLLPEWLQVEVSRAPGRAATLFLQEVQGQLNETDSSGRAWWWAHAAEALADTPQPEAWQRPFVESAPVEAAKRLGELATAAKKPEVDLRERALWASACHRQARGLQSAPSAAVEAFRAQELEALAEDLRNELTGANTTAPSLGRGLDGALLAGMGATSAMAETGFTDERRGQDVFLALKQIIESGSASLPTILV